MTIIVLVETEEEKRQRLADAIQTRVNTEENIHDNAVRQGIKREFQVESLKSKCAYCVAGKFNFILFIFLRYS